jgi:hypothetical protein
MITEKPRRNEGKNKKEFGNGVDVRTCITARKMACENKY